jgi:hypothetical protein
MLIRTRALLAAPLLVLSLATAQAAEPVSSAAKKGLVQKVLQMQQPGIDGIARTLAEQPVAPMMQQVAGLLRTRVPEDKREALSKEIQGDFKKYTDATVPLLRDRAKALAPTTIGAVLEQKFSEDELKQLVAWLESPLARKYQTAFPEFQRSLTEKLVAETRPMVEPNLRELDAAITRRLTAYAGTPAGAGASKP